MYIWRRRLSPFYYVIKFRHCTEIFETAALYPLRYELNNRYWCMCIFWCFVRASILIFIVIYRHMASSGGRKSYSATLPRTLGFQFKINPKDYKDIITPEAKITSI